MFQLVTGFVLAIGSLFAWTVGAQFVWLRHEPRTVAMLSVAIVLIPAAAAWAVAELIQAVTPRRVFDRRVSAAWQRFFAGGFAGFLAAGLGMGVLPMADRLAPDAAIMGFMAAVGVGLVMLPLSRVRVGHCIHCNYDLGGLTGPDHRGSAVCPECGAAAQG